MKALVVHGAKDICVDTVEDPKIQDARDVIIRVTSMAVGFEPNRNQLDRAEAVVNLEKDFDKGLTTCMSAVRRGGAVTVPGVYSSLFDNFPIHQFFDKGITLRGGQAPAHKHIDKLMQHVSNGDVVLNDIITHRLPLSEAAHGYDIFRNKKDGCVKVTFTPVRQHLN